MGDGFTLPLRVVSEANAHEHWRVRQRRAKAQRRATCLAWLAAGLPLKRKPVEVRLTRLAPRKLDSDNAVGALKHVRDAVAECCGFDDREESVRWLYAQERAKEYGVRVEVDFGGAA